MRAFVAVELTDEARASVAACATEVRAALGPRARGLAFVKPASMHLTLAFLGDVDDALVPPVGMALAGVARVASPFELELQGTGGFPLRRDPRVLWVGVGDGARELTAIAERVHEVTRTLGFPSSERAFFPHLTLARVKERETGRAALASIQRFATTRFGRMSVREFVLFRSETKPEGAVHTPLRRFTLGA